MAIYGIIREPGAGKTATLTYMALCYFMQGFKLFSNYVIKEPVSGAPLSKLVRSRQELNAIKKGYAFLDELWDLIDSRLSMDEANLFYSGLLLKARKRGYNVIYTVHSMNQIDKRLRENTDKYLIPYTRIKINGRTMNFSQSILRPLPMRLLLPYMYIEVMVVNAITEEIEEIFEFKLDKIARFYDTSEEIEKLTNERAGNEFERLFAEAAFDELPGAKIVQCENSGANIEPPTLDYEITIDKKLFIIDVVKLSADKVKDHTNYYIDSHGKKYKHFQRIVKERKAAVYFAYQVNNADSWMIANALETWELLNAKKSNRLLSQKKLLQISRPLKSLMTIRRSGLRQKTETAYNKD